jgi:hypothetical protein
MVISAGEWPSIPASPTSYNGQVSGARAVASGDGWMSHG